jgi:dephospho-CoA kinase
MKIGLTGNYFSGHDEVGKIFKKLNVSVFDADLLLRYFINFSPTHIKKIQTNLGKNSYSLGVLNIDKFSKKSQLEDLLDLCEFDILLAYARFRLLMKDQSYTIFKYSFLFEREMESDFDYIINCSRPKTLRDKDLKNYTQIPTIAINNILDGEMSENEKNISSNYIVRNNEPDYLKKGFDKWSDVYDQVERIHNSLSKKIPQTILGD